MDSKEDPPSSSKAKYFHICSEEPDDPFNYNIIEIPTVVGFLKNILAQYPDNGQIIKELVQNAEDAGATVVEVLHDERNVKCPKIHKDIQRFLKGPALCLYNDGTFTEDDWTGIRKLSDSIKKNDPLKVGQFGLGFKSVFHITDFVTIISGNKVLFMDPSEPENKMCRIISLKKLTSICPLDDCLRLWSCYISTQNITDGQFPATLFWFPLRQSPSDISNTIYTYNHVITLFESFSIEASLCLTFLKSIEKICLKRINKWNKSPVTTHEVKLISPIMTEVQQKRKVFKQKLVECKGCPSQTITCDYEVTVESVRCNQTKQQMMHILHYLPGSSDPSTVTWRGEDSCKHMPLVGIAAPVTAHSVASPTATHSDETSITTGRTTLNTGHIFCFLPLPLETDNKTNLPVQINGFFALDQNRRHVKWKTEENSIEPDVLWNEDLVSRAVVEAYFTFLQNVLSDLKEKSSPHHLETWYGLLPHIDSTKGRWKKLGVELWSRLKSMPILYSDVKDCMMTPEDVLTEESLNDWPQQVSNTVRSFLREHGFPVASVPEPLLSSLHYLGSAPSSIKPQALRKYLKTIKSIKIKWNRSHLLEYVISDKNYNDLEGIPLLPLHNGKWDTFSQTGRSVYICGGNAGAFLGLEDQILSIDLPSQVVQHMHNLAEKDDV